MKCEGVFWFKLLVGCHLAQLSVDCFLCHLLRWLCSKL